MDFEFVLPGYLNTCLYSFEAGFDLVCHSEIYHPNDLNGEKIYSYLATHSSPILDVVRVVFVFRFLFDED